MSAASFYVALVLLACGGKAGSDDAKPSGGSGNGDLPEATGGTDGNAGRGGTAGEVTGPADRGGGPGMPDPEQPFSDPIPVGEVPPCIEDAPPLLEGYTYHALYRFEEERGPALVDTIGVGQGTMQGASRSDGQCGRGVSLTEGAHLELSNLGPVFQNGIAIGLWVRPSSLVEGEAHLVGDGGGGVTSFQLVLEDGVPVFRLADSNYQWRDLMRANDALELGAWQYVQAAYNLDAGSLYVDGREVATTSLVYSIEGSYNTLAVGAITDTDGECCMLEHGFLGDLDEIAIYAATPAP